MNTLSIYPPTLNGTSVQDKRREIKKYFNNTFTLYEKVFELLKDDSIFYKKSEITRHPMIFYFGHTATFFINKLINMKIIQKRINSKFESIFAVGVDEMQWDDMEKSYFSTISIDDVRAYRESVRVLINSLIDSVEMQLPIKQKDPMWIILMGIEHERIHVETSLVLHRQMPLEFVKDVLEFSICQKADKAPVNSMVEIPARDVNLAKTQEHPLYGWDNEYGEYEESVHSFSTSKYLVSNEEYLKFVESGGYEHPAFWDEEGLEFLKKTSVTHPPFWVEKKGVYYYRTLSKIIPMPMNWPVEVNALEAEAFCRYKSQLDGITYQLPSEAEHRSLYEFANLRDIPDLHESRANLNFYHYSSSCPVDEFGFNGVYDVIGNVWQWSRTPIRGFKGFEVHEAYDDFSTPTFDEKHSLILGSSWASSGNLIMKYSRYAFRKHFYQNAGFRYVISKQEEEKKEDIYESDTLVAQYCEFQYGDTHFGVENFALATAKIATNFTKKRGKALDLGCATGRASYELAKAFESVDGIDFSVRFVQVGAKLQSDGFVAFEAVEEGELKSKKRVTLKELGYENIAKRVSFWQGDACNLKEHHKAYDLIMATNLIDRLYNPMLFLEEMKNRLNESGILVLTSPYTWQESSTKKEFWLGGYTNERGEAVHTLESLKKILEKDFTLLHTQDVPFVIKETKRKFQHTLSELSVWQKK